MNLRSGDKQIIITQRAAALAVLVTQTLFLLAVLIEAVFDDTPEPGQLWVSAIMMLVSLALLVAYQQGWELARSFNSLMLSVLIGLLMPEPFVTKYAPVVLALPLAITLVLAGPWWVLGSGLTTLALLVVRAGGHGVYTSSFTLSIYITILVALIIHQNVLQGDIQLRRQAEQRLRASNELLEEALAELERERARLVVTLASIGDAVITTDIEGRVTFLNPIAEQLTGWDSSVYGRPLHEVFTIIDAFTRAPLEDPASAVLRQQRPSALSSYPLLIARDGHETAIEDSGAPIRDSEGATHGVVLVFRDVGAQRAAEQALRASEERFAKAFHASPAALAILRLSDECFLDANESLCQLLGFQRSDLLERNLLELELYADLQQRAEVLNQLAMHGRLRNVELTIRTRSGENRMMLWSMEPIELNDEAALLSTMIDITPRKQAETKLRDLNNQLEQHVVARTRELRAARDRAQALYAITNSVIQSDDLRDALQQTVDHVSAIVRANRAIIVIFNWESSSVQYNLHGGPGATADIPDVGFEELMEGLTGWAIRHRRPAISPAADTDPRESPRTMRRRHETGVGAVVVVPLYQLGEVFGTLTTLNRVGDPDFTPADIELMNGMAGQISIAYARQLLTEQLRTANVSLQAEIAERTQLAEQIRSNAERVTALADLSQALAEATRETQAVFDLVAEWTMREFGDITVIVLLSDGQQSAEIKVIAHPEAEQMSILKAAFSQRRFPVTPFMHRILSRGQALLLQPTDNIADVMLPEYRSLIERFKPSGLAVVPLRAREHIIGLIYLARISPSPPYTAADQVFLQDLADRAGLAISNALLFAEANAARAEAERANQAKSAFLTSMSHELRTPLNAILGFTGTLLMQLPGPLNAAQEHQLNTVQRSARQLISLINDILDLAKIEAGRVDIHPTVIQCQSTLAAIVGSLRPLADAKRLNFASDFPAEPVMLCSDERALHRILVNLIGNAIKFTDQGEVRVMVRQHLNDGMVHVEFAVHDTGIGIRPTDQTRLFQEFGRVDSAEVREREGTGLGLRIAYQLAHMLGGTITLTSVYGQGSTFTLMLPDTPNANTRA